jgi:hypothetical protein
MRDPIELTVARVIIKVNNGESAFMSGHSSAFPAIFVGNIVAIITTAE